MPSSSAKGVYPHIDDLFPVVQQQWHGSRQGVDFVPKADKGWSQIQLSPVFESLVET